MLQKRLLKDNNKIVKRTKYKQEKESEIKIGAVLEAAALFACQHLRSTCAVLAVQALQNSYPAIYGPFSHIKHVR